MGTPRHGKSHSPEYQCWADMKTRCLNPRHKWYPEYGGRGITVCERWMRFDFFWEDMGPRPSSKHTLDRKDNDKGYEPTNCRWATPSRQQRNRRDSITLTFRGRTMSIHDWAEETGIAHPTIRHRIVSYGWSVEEALTIAVSYGNKIGLGRKGAKNVSKPFHLEGKNNARSTDTETTG